MNNKLVIRNAVPTDTSVILELIKELADYEKLSNEVTATAQDLQNNLFAENTFIEVLIAEYEYKPAGYALFFYNFSTFTGKPGLYLEDLFVKPAFRNLGIGKALLERIIKLAKDRNCGRVEWSVLDWNESAIDFYKSRGAVPMEGWTIFRLSENKF